MTRILLIIGLTISLGNFALKAQFIDNKIDLKVTYGIALPLGDEIINEENYITPSLFRGYGLSYYHQIEGIYNCRPNYGLGVSLTKFNFSNWTNSDSELYANSSSYISSFGPVIKLHTTFKQTGPQNNFELFTTLSPYIAFIKSKINQEALFSIEPITELPPVIESTYSSFGGNISVGANYTIAQNIDVNLEIGGSYTKLNSQFYNDKSIVLFNVGAGIVFKFAKNRRYYL